MVSDTIFPHAMKKASSLWIAALLVMCSRAVFAQDLTGDWQGALPRANHYVFVSNDADVLREMFIASLK